VSEERSAALAGRRRIVHRTNFNPIQQVAVAA